MKFKKKWKWLALVVPGITLIFPAVWLGGSQTMWLRVVGLAVGYTGVLMILVGVCFSTAEHFKE